MSKKAPLISVIIPAYNAEETIERCLDSILKQSIVNDLEIIIIDDASTDNTSSVLHRYVSKYDNILLKRMKKNKPIGHVRNIGLGLSSGEYIGFVDADDYIAPNMYEKLVETAKKTHSEMAVCRRIDKFEDTARTREYHFKRSLAGQQEIDIDCSEKLSMLITNLTLFPWDKIYRRDTIQMNNLKFPPYYYAEDGSFILQFLYHCQKISLVDKPLYYHMLGKDSSVTTTFSETWLDIKKSLQLALQYYIDHGVYLTYASALRKVAIGYYARRLRALREVKSNKPLQHKFARGFQTMLDEYCADWRFYTQRYYPDLKKVISSNWATNFYISAPLAIKKILAPSINRKASAFKKMRYERIKFAYCSRFLRIVQNRVLFVSNSGGTMSCNPFYMAEELSKDSNFEIFIASKHAANDMMVLRRRGVRGKIVKTHSNEFVKILATAKYIVTNSRVPAYFNKRPGQVFINTWHGTPLKTLGFDMKSSLKDVGNNQTQFLMSDYLLYPNEYTRDHMFGAFYLDMLFTNRVILSGYPRNIPFFDTKYSNTLRKKMGLENKKIFVYMPTWRGNSTSNIEAETSQAQQLLSELDNLVDDDSIIFVKMHSLANCSGRFLEKRYKHIRPVDELIETYRFISMADCLITDYSSVFYDFANTKKDIVLFIYDYDEYVSGRGVYVDVASLPFKKIYTTKALAEYIRNFAPNTPTIQYKHFLENYCCYDDADNAKRVNDIIFRNLSQPDRYLQNAKKSWSAIFVDKDSLDERLFSRLKKDSLLVFSQPKFDGYCDDFITKHRDKLPAIIISPGSTPNTIYDYMLTFLLRKLGLKCTLVKKSYLRKLQRILPGITIKSVDNLSNIKIFGDFEKLFKEGVK